MFQNSSEIQSSSFQPLVFLSNVFIVGTVVAKMTSLLSIYSEWKLPTAEDKSKTYSFV